MITESATSGNLPAVINRLSGSQSGNKPSFGLPPTAVGCDTGYPVLQPHEADPNPGEWPPDFKNPTQAALSAQARGFELMPLRADGTPLDPNWQSNVARTADGVCDHWASATQSKVGAITAGLVVVALYQDDPDLADTLHALQAEKTAAMLSRLQRRVLFIFRLPPGMRVVEGTLPSGLDVLNEDYMTVPSGSPTDGCRWLNRCAIAPAPLWLLDQFAPPAEVQTLKDNDTTGAGSAATDTTFFTNAFLPPAHVQSSNAAGGIR
jgi:Bifunctional DNA primase/polymerase, N-terminal